ncbi:Lrp/AsnC family transcriptional regulator [archaeon]|nr:MAG: Lrp/AsnC family transcriptional regulator [archaeon]
MVNGYILVKTSAGTALRVLGEIKKIEQVTKACAVAGLYDIIVEFSVERVEDTAKLIVDKIHAIEGVTDTQTFICVSS